MICVFGSPEGLLVTELMGCPWEDQEHNQSSSDKVGVGRGRHEEWLHFSI